MATKMREHLGSWSSDRISIRAPIENKEASTIKPFSGLDPAQTTINFFNNQLDSFPTNSKELAGGRKQECKILEKVGEIIEPLTPKQVGEEMVKIEHELKNIKRMDFPIFLDPKTASFLDIAIHAKIRQYLSDSTIEKNLRYARFMETHPCPINFRKLTPEQFIRHMDYRIEIENATPHALAHERKVIMMFLRAYGISDENWKIICKTPPIIISEDVEVPFPTIVHKFFTYKYSKNKYESRLLQSVVFMGFMFGMRPPSEICNLNLEDLVINEDDTGYLVIHEQKKRGKKRIIIPFNKAVLSSPVYKTPKNYIKHWRHKVANQNSKNALFLQPNGKRVTGRYLRAKLSPAGKKIAGEYFHLYTMRHTYATYLYNYTKDINLVSKALGHTKLNNTTKYIHVAEWMQHQVGGNLFNHSLKPHNVVKTRLWGNRKKQVNAKKRVNLTKSLRENRVGLAGLLHSQQIYLLSFESVFLLKSKFKFFTNSPLFSFFSVSQILIKCEEVNT